jgi:hypothetical protein
MVMSQKGILDVYVTQRILGTAPQEGAVGLQTICGTALRAYGLPGVPGVGKCEFVYVEEEEGALFHVLSGGGDSMTYYGP